MYSFGSEFLGLLSDDIRLDQYLNLKALIWYRCSLPDALHCVREDEIHGEERVISSLHILQNTVNLPVKWDKVIARFVKCLKKASRRLHAALVDRQNSLFKTRGRQ